MSDRKTPDQTTLTGEPGSASVTPSQSVAWLDTDHLVKQQALGQATSSIEYRSEGHCLVIGSIEQCVALSQQLTGLKTTWLVTAAKASSQSAGMMNQRLTEEGVTVIESGVSSEAMQLNGHMGAFDVSVKLGNLTVTAAAAAGGAVSAFDLIADATPGGIQSAQLPPFGYLHVPESDDGMIAGLTDLVGEFEKPRYFDYNLSKCAHSRSQLAGCSRCIDVCSTQAITPSGEGVEVDPYLCQGCGTCATVCPSGAMTYAWPRVPQAIDTSRSLKDQQPVAASVLLLYKQQDDVSADAAFEQSLPPNVMPVAVEEVTAFGIDYWATMLAAGFSAITIYTEGTTDTASLQPLRDQAKLLTTILGPLGFTEETVEVTQADSLTDTLDRLTKLPPREAAGPAFSTHDQKRQTIRMAIDQLIEQYAALGGATESVPTSVPLINGSPFGQLSLDASACTLCMACVSVCPVNALLDGQGSPKVRFIEADCVQCGLCETACPEDAIERQPRYTYDSVAARHIVTLHEDSPFHCIRCHKAFATSSMIDTMTAKLAGHWMFSDGKAMRRLKMCEDCRVVDMFEDDAGGIEVHRDS